MPSRIIRDSCRTSPTLDQLSDGAERMFWRLTTVADDFGRFETDPRILLSGCFPLRVHRIKTDTISKWLQEMETCGLLTTYVVNDRSYGFFRTWEKHQRVRAKESKYPAPTSADICGHPPSNAPVVIGYGVKGKGYKEEGKEEPPLPPKGNLSVELPDWLPLDQWTAYLDMRKTLKRPLTPHGQRLAVTALEKLQSEGHDPKAVLEQSILHSWQGLFAIKEPANGNRADRRDSQPHKTTLGKYAHLGTVFDRGGEE